MEVERSATGLAVDGRLLQGVGREDPCAIPRSGRLVRVPLRLLLDVVYVRRELQLLSLLLLMTVDLSCVGVDVFGVEHVVGIAV